MAHFVSTMSFLKKPTNQTTTHKNPKQTKKATKTLILSKITSTIISAQCAADSSVANVISVVQHKQRLESQGL